MERHGMVGKARQYTWKCNYNALASGPRSDFEKEDWRVGAQD